MRRYATGPLVLATLTLGWGAHAAEEDGGPELGARTTAFNVHDVTGPNKGKSLCYR